MRSRLPSILVIIISTASLCYAQNPTLYGMSEEGGTDNRGIIFNYNLVKDTETIIHDFNSPDGEFPTYNSLIQANDGLLYGMTMNGGAYSNGTIFSYNISTDLENVLHSFGNDTDGSEPWGSLIQANDTLLYGMTYAGGANGDGSIFSYNINTKTETVLHSFGSGTDGSFPYRSLMQANNGLLYGMTSAGGSYLFGTIFSYEINTGKEKVLHSFGRGPDGYQPYGSLIQASDSLLYGMASSGGAPDTGLLGKGIIFSYNISTGIETIIHDFGNGNDGHSPRSTLIQASNGLLYGITFYGGGGTNDTINDGDGIIFSYDISTGSETVLHSFGNGTDGSGSFGSLIQASNGLLYGMSEDGGINDLGIIFSYNISTGIETDLLNFNRTNGAYPGGDLLEVDTPTTSIKQLLLNNQLSIYPNPTTGQFTIKLNGNQNGYTVEIYNVVGEKVYESVLSSEQNTINLSSQPAGMYFVYLKSDEGVEVGKVLVAK